MGEAVHTCFSHADRVSEETLPKLVNSIGVCDKWADKDAACAQSPPSDRNLLSSTSVVRKSQGHI